jgi:hypothetical protein
MSDHARGQYHIVDEAVSGQVMRQESSTCSGHDTIEFSVCRSGQETGVQYQVRS